MEIDRYIYLSIYLYFVMMIYDDLDIRVFWNIMIMIVYMYV